MLIHCGDFTNHGSLAEVLDFAEWFASQPHPRKLCVPGNHDMLLDEDYYEAYWSDWSRVKESHADAKAAFASKNIELLIDQMTSIEGVTFYGSPWVAQGHDWKTAFNKQDSELEACWARIPDSDVPPPQTSPPPPPPPPRPLPRRPAPLRLLIPKQPRPSHLRCC